MRYIDPWLLMVGCSILLPLAYVAAWTFYDCLSEVGRRWYSAAVSASLVVGVILVVRLCLQKDI